MITVKKASAGSGKTFALAEKYINMLMAAYMATDESHDRHAYKHILAVTFTNKATEEMKSRILEELYKVAHPEKETSNMKVPQKPEVAAAILSDILHDYSSFAVSTIDKFFQQTLRAFARELGHFNRYEVELDKNSLVDEAVDTILDELDASREDDLKMIDFMVANLQEDMQEGKGYNVERALKDMGKQLKSASFATKMAAMGLNPAQAYSQDALLALRKDCSTVVASFLTGISERSERIAQWMTANGVDSSAFNGGFVKQMLKNAGVKSWDMFSAATAASVEKASDRNLWFAQKKQKDYAHLSDSFAGVIEPWLEFYNSNYPVAATAVKLRKCVYGLGVASRLFQAFDRIAKEKNVLCLEDSNELLFNIIDGSDAPFVYEKTGVRFKTFMLDEFQDTATTQWKNFEPLLRESEGHKGDGSDDTFDNLVVGDVKQSIYRWRSSDWSLMDHQLEEDFSGQTRNKPLEHNWRSTKAVVDFNNALYPAISKTMDAMVQTPSGSHSIQDIYKDSFQYLAKPEKQAGGCVDVRFMEDKEAQIAALVDKVKELCADGKVSYSDIAVLVRSNKNGSLVAHALGDAGINVVTEASLRVKASATVGRLVAMMSYVDNPVGKVSEYFLKQAGLLDVPEAYHSLCGLAETLYAKLLLNPALKADCEKEVMYVTSFMDAVMNFSRTNGDNLHAFLQWWDEQDVSVNATAGDGAVRIITIHKSKGLAFPYVIIPFIEDITIYNSTRTSMWATPQAKGTALEAYMDKLYYVPVSSSDSGTLFSQTYAVEAFNQALDAMNLLYVATTRAEYGMLLLASPGKNMGKVLYDYAGRKDIHVGEEFSYTHKEKSRTAVDVPFSFPTCQLQDRLSIRPYAADFFLDEGNDFEHLSYLDKGIVMHDILSAVVVPTDLEKAVDEQIAQGALSAASKERVMKFLGSRIASRPEFFPNFNVRVLNETTLLGPDGREHRPDRVLVYPDGSVTVVDYKFGSPKPEYEAQIALYADLFKSMGYTKVQAHLWYLYPNKIF